MKTAVDRQQESVSRIKQSPCQCLVYHPKFGTEIYNELMAEYMEWRSTKPSKTSVDKTWIIVHLLISQDCPYIKEK